MADTLAQIVSRYYVFLRWTVSFVRQCNLIIVLTAVFSYPIGLCSNDVCCWSAGCAVWCGTLAVLCECTACCRSCRLFHLVAWVGL